MLSVPGSTPMSCMKSANISVLTTDAAELRVIVETSNPNAAIPARGSTYTARLANIRPSPRPAETDVPDSDVKGWKPQATEPATTPTTPIAATMASVYVKV